MRNIVNATWIDVKRRKVVLKGIRYDIPLHITGLRTSIVNGTIYIDGYELKKNGKWKRSLKAFWYCYISR